MSEALFNIIKSTFLKNTLSQTSGLCDDMQYRFDMLFLHVITVLSDHDLICGSWIRGKLKLLHKFHMQEGLGACQSYEGNFLGDCWTTQPELRHLARFNLIRLH